MFLAHIQQANIVKPSDTTLTLFFTRRVGLHHWQRVGNLQREAAVYQALSKQLKGVQFVTYGGRRDQAYLKQVAPVQAFPTPGYMPVVVSQLVLRQSYDSLLRQSDIFKTNQIPGAEIALWAKKRYGKKLITRCGYLYSRFMDAYTGNRLRIKRAYQLEKAAFYSADAGIVTSERDRQWVIETHGITPQKLHVIPNYVVTNVFKPVPNLPKKYDLVCVSKASPQKNLPALFRALKQLAQNEDTPSLLLIGSAADDAHLRQQAEEQRLKVTFISRVANFDLPTYLNQAKIFILPSLYEGHPKALLEAMSCGLPCIGTDVPGIREDLQHLKTGYLCQPEAASIAGAIRTVTGSLQIQETLGENARGYIVERYSLSTIVDLELAIIDQVLATP